MATGGIANVMAHGPTHGPAWVGNEKSDGIGDGFVYGAVFGGSVSASKTTTTRKVQAAAAQKVAQAAQDGAKAGQEIIEVTRQGGVKAALVSAVGAGLFWAVVDSFLKDENPEALDKYLLP